MRYEFLVGLRYTRSRKRAQGRNRFISFISLVSMLGIALGVAALIVVLSVMNGFQEELRTRILGVASHVQVHSPAGGLSAWQQVAEESLRHPDVRGAAPYVQEQGMLSFDEVVRSPISPATCRRAASRRCSPAASASCSAATSRWRCRCGRVTRSR
jgi:lipoprotein-releasing system permease protein